MKRHDLLFTLAEHTNIKPEDMEELWSLCSQGVDEVSVAKFTEGVLLLNEAFKPKTLLRLQEIVAKDMRTTRDEVTEQINTRFEQVLHEVRAPLGKIHAVTEQVQVLGAMATWVRNKLEEPRLAPPSSASAGGRRDVELMEEHFNARIQEVKSCLAKFEVVPLDSKGSAEYVTRSGSISVFGSLFG